MIKGVKHIFLDLFLLLIVQASLLAQSTNNMVFEFETVGLTSSGDFAPFWHTSNRQGLPSVEKNNGYMHFALLGDMFQNGCFSVKYGIDMGIGAGLESNCFIHQLFSDINYKCFGFEVGLKERLSDKNRLLSSGALTWSGNSRPIPEVRMGIPEYVVIPLLGGWFSIKGHLGYGRLTDDRWRRSNGSGSYIEKILFHSKSAFLRFGDENRFPLKITLGLEMNNMFGGIQHVGDDVIVYPSDASAYWTALLPFNHIEQQGIDDGNNLGSWHLNFDYKLSDWDLRAYYEHYFEDHSSMLGIEYKNNTEGKKEFIFYGFRHNWFDGLFGIELNAPNNIKFFHNVVFEFLNTRGLSGPICHSGALKTTEMEIKEEIDGRDDMYYHYIYDSYTHWGYVIGNPVIVSPIYNKNYSERIRSNRVQMFHLGVDGSLTDNIDYRILATTTKHWGRYGAPLKKVERITSVMLECTYKFGDEYGWRVSLSGAADFDSAVGSGGQTPLLGNNKGVMLTVSKTWKVL